MTDIEDLGIAILLISASIFVFCAIIFLITMPAESIAVQTLDKVCVLITNDSNAMYYEQLGIQDSFPCQINSTVTFYAGVGK